MNKSFNFILWVLLIVGALTTVAVSGERSGSENNILRNAYAANDNWYVGKGAQPNTYYTYKIQNADT